MQKTIIKIEKNHQRQLTNRQKTFAELYVEGIYSNKECALRSGYQGASAKVHASRLLNPQEYPHVVEYIDELRQMRERKYGVTLIGQLKRLHDLSHGAETSGQFSASINAEKIRSALGGLTTDRRENIHSLDSMTRDEKVARISQLQKKYHQVFIEGNFNKLVHKEWDNIWIPFWFPGNMMAFKK